MKKIILAAATLAFLLSGCNSDSKNAGKLFQRAELAFAAGDYNLARLQRFYQFIPQFPRRNKMHIFNILII